MAKFAQYAIASAQEALTDAGWMPTKEEDLEATVRESIHGLRDTLLTTSGCVYWFWHRLFG